VAHWLAERPDVGAVLHPALPSHPQHALWKRDFQGASGLFSFELRLAALAGGGADEGLLARQMAALANHRRFFRIGYSWGGYESLIMPARLNGLRTVQPWTGGPLVRLHIGLEEPADLIADLQAGFAAMHAVN
jgi:cystathionine beta-lyase